MKNLMLRSGALLACALSLASCGGGGDGNLYLGGMVYNMTKPGLKLANNGGTPIEIAPTQPGGAREFFIEGLESDDRFNITVVSQPEGSECTPFRNVGKMGSYSIPPGGTAGVQFRCRNLPKNLGGRLAAPLDSPLTLNNGSDQVTIPAGQTSFTFTVKNASGEVLGGTVGHGEPFGVTVLTQPVGKTCTVQNGTGTMLNDYNDVLVTCQ